MEKLRLFLERCQVGRWLVLVTTPWRTGEHRLHLPAPERAAGVRVERDDDRAGAVFVPEALKGARDLADELGGDRVV